MDKKSGPEGASSQAVKTDAGVKAKIDSRQAGKGSANVGKGSPKLGVYTNEFGDVCYGTECFTLACDPVRKQIRVEVRRDACECEIEPMLDLMKDMLGQGARTIYEIPSPIETNERKLTKEFIKEVEGK